MANFDQHIKEQFNNYSPEVNPAIWNRIVAERERRRPKGFWFTLANGKNLLLLIALFIAAGAGALILLNNTDKKSSIATTDNNTADNKSNSSVNISNPSSVIQQNNIVDAANNSVSPNNNDVQFTSPAVNPGISSPLPNANQIPAGNTSLFFGNRNKTNTDNNNFVKSNNNTHSVTSEGYDAVTNDAISNPLAGSLMGRLLFGAQKIAAEKNNNNQLRDRLMPNVFLPDCPSIEDNAAGNKKYFELYAGPDIAFRSFSDTGNSAYLQKRKESTKFSSAYSAGVRYTRVFNNGMSLRTGINYSQINEKFTFLQGNLVQVTYIIDANGDTTGSYTVTGTRYKTTHNKYRSVDIPLLAGYELGNGRLHANINAGAIINAYSWQKGDVLDTAFQPVSITTGKASTPYGFKTNLGVGFIGAVSVYYKLNDKVHLMAEPYYRHNFSQMNKEKITLKQKYNTAGIRLGIRIDLP